MYPPIPLHAAKKTNLRKLQIIQNKSLRYVYGIRYPDRIRNETLHNRAELKTMNVMLHEQANKTWRKINEQLPEETAEWLQQQNPRAKEHYWLPKSREKALGPTPEPIY